METSNDALGLSDLVVNSEYCLRCGLGDPPMEGYGVGDIVVVKELGTDRVIVYGKNSPNTTLDSVAIQDFRVGTTLEAS